MDKIKVLIVDDTIFYRKILGDILKDMPDVEVVGSAGSGKIALNRIESLKPDLVTLDVEMPGMNGLEVLEEIQNKKIDVGVLMVSTLTGRGSQITIRALELGAFDFIEKPLEGISMKENMEKVRSSLVPIIQAFLRRKKFKINFKTGFSKSAPSAQAAKKTKAVKTRVAPVPGIKSKSEIIAIGVSTGGPNALAKVIPMLPENLGVPVVIVQHMPPVFTASLAKSLDNKSRLKVVEAGNGMAVTANTVYIAPGGRQMKLAASNDGQRRLIKITDDPPENSCKPSVDYLFRSIADYYVGRATGVIMTGMGSDGYKGLVEMYKKNATIIAQNEETCIVYGMPKAPVDNNIVHVVAPLEKIADEIVATVQRRI
ncbi:MAG: chemotaxis response regulator protein-glutamate methylesterase [Deltaproteobacteria bacterium]|nr:MAG: chemotaxis response regulator protein-glutamate methylesterase [Deltaproteobacteria bacterium]